MENKYRFRDSSLSFDERVKDLLSRLTIKEKAGLMSSHMAAVPRLDIGEWYVGAEVARGYVSRNPDEPTTVFPQPIGLSGTFDTELMEKARTADNKYDVGILRTADDCILRRIVTMIFKDNDIPPNMKAVESCVGIIRAGQGKINPCQFRFVQIRKKKLFVVTDREKFRRN